MRRHEEIVKGKAKSIKADLVFKHGKAKLNALFIGKDARKMIQ